MGLPAKVITAVFYKTAAGNEPVRDFLAGLSAADRKSIGGDIGQVERNWPKVSKPLVDGLGKGLFEVRTNLKDRIARVYFGVEQGKMALLHGIVKKTQKAPPPDVALARDRLKDWQASL